MTVREKIDVAILIVTSVAILGVFVHMAFTFDLNPIFFKDEMVAHYAPYVEQQRIVDLNREDTGIDASAYWLP